MKSTQKYKYETKSSKGSRYRDNKQSTQQCKIHEIRITNETVNQVAVPPLISYQWLPRGNLLHDHRMSENPWHTWWKIATGKRRDGISARPWHGCKVGPIWRRGGIPVVCRWWSQLCPTHQWEMIRGVNEACSTSLTRCSYRRHLRFSGLMSLRTSSVSYFKLFVFKTKLMCDIECAWI